MAFPDEFENFGEQLLGNIESNVQAGGTDGLQDLTSVSGVEGLLEKSIPGFGQGAAADQSADSSQDNSGN